MISITAYWQQFKECIDNLQISNNDEEYSRQLATAQLLIGTGLTIEKLGITEIQQVVNQLQEQAKLFRHEVVYTADKEYTFSLPKITNSATLIFAIIYYQHLNNNQNVCYQGSINWFRQRIIDAVNQKKIVTAVQTKALLQEIRDYCQKQNIVVNESLFLKAQDESVKDYTTRIGTLFNKQNERVVHDSSPIDEVSILEESLEQLQEQWNKLLEKTNSITQKLSALNKAKQVYHAATEQWENKWLVTRAIFGSISLFFVVPAINNLQRAEEQLLLAENELKQEIPQKNSASYIINLQNKQQQLKHEQEKIHKELIQKKKIHQEKQKEIKKNASMHLMPNISQQNPPKITATKIKEQSSHVEEAPDDHYGFFTQHLPSRYTLQAIAVGATAVAIQNLL